MADKIRVTAIQRLCVNDGPGVRTVVFLKGCYLQCPWCCNPEAIHYAGDEYFDKGICKYPEKNPICWNCELPGGNVSKEECPFGAFEKTYRDYNVEELHELLMRDENLYRNGGGVTFSGGEPLLQARELKPLLEKLKEENIHIAFETTLFAPTKHYDTIKNLVDYWLVDLKFQFGYITNHDYSIDRKQFEENIKDLQGKISAIQYRMVIMSEVMDSKLKLVDSILSHGIDRIELLPCHSLAKFKYMELHRQFHQFMTPTKEELRQFCNLIKSMGIEVGCMSL